MNKIVKRVLTILGWTVLGTLIAINIWNVADRLSNYKCPPFGVRYSAIGSGSMEVIYPGREDLPADTYRIAKGDVIKTYNVSKYEDLKKYDVITYLDDKTLICHRIIDLYESDGKQFILTQGDANNLPDKPFEFDLVRGKVSGVVSKGLGDFMIFMGSGYGMMALLLTAGFICLGFFIYYNISKKADNNPENPTEEQPVEEELKPVEQPAPADETVAHAEELPAEEPIKEEQPKVEETPEPVVKEEPKPEEKLEPEKKNGRFIPKGGGQKRLNWPPKNTRWTKDNNPTTNKKRAEAAKAVEKDK